MPLRKNSGRNEAMMMSDELNMGRRTSRDASNIVASNALVPCGRSRRRLFVHILDIDNGVIDQRADGDGDAAKTHCIDRQTHEMQGYERDDNRERQRDKRDERGAHIHQEEEEDYDDEYGPDKQRLAQVGDGTVYEIGLPEYVGVNRDVGRECGCEPCELLLNLVCQRYCARAGLFGHGDEDGIAGRDRSGSQTWLLAPYPHIGDVREPDKTRGV